MQENKRLYWMSWYQNTEDFRPLNYPPNEDVLGWWCTGWAEAGHTLCAHVLAENEEEALKVVAKDWPEAKLRFVNQRSCIIPHDRFVPSDWMIERIKPWSEEVLITTPLKALDKKFSEVIDSIKDVSLMQVLVNVIIRLKKRNHEDVTLADDIDTWTKIITNSDEKELYKIFIIQDKY